jgi:hypothetical protein
VGLKSLKSPNLTNGYPNKKKKKKNNNNKVKSKPLELRSRVKIQNILCLTWSAANLGSASKNLGGLGPLVWEGNEHRLIEIGLRQIII